MGSIWTAIYSTFEYFQGCTPPINQGELLQGWQQTNNGGTRWYPVAPWRKEGATWHWSRPVSIATREKGCPSDPSSVSIQSSDASDSGNEVGFIKKLDVLSKPSSLNPSVKLTVHNIHPKLDAKWWWIGKHGKNMCKWLSHDRFGFTVLLIGWKSGPNVLS